MSAVEIQSVATSVLARIAERSVRIGDCLVWTGAMTTDGYGRLKVNGRMERTHRAAWVAHHGPIPSETPLVLHRCDNPPCSEISHLFLGTTQDNVTDKMEKGRHRNGLEGQTHCRHGHSYAEVGVYLSKTSRTCRACALARAAAARAKARAL